MIKVGHKHAELFYSPCMLFAWSGLGRVPACLMCCPFDCPQCKAAAAEEMVPVRFRLRKKVRKTLQSCCS